MCKILHLPDQGRDLDQIWSCRVRCALENHHGRRHGKGIDNCIPDRAPDDKLFKLIPEKKSLKIDLVMKDTAQCFWS